MIAKKGNKTDRTVMMENAISTYFQNVLSLKLKPEYHVSTGIVDFIGFEKANDEIKDAVVIEIKQSAADFYSGHGLNFVGSSNYVAVPSELVGFTIEFLRNENYDNVGVLEVTNEATVRIVTYPKYNRLNEFVPLGISHIWLTPLHLRDKLSA